jgi:hypothetical protein
LAYGSHSGTIVLLFASVPSLKNVTKRQSKSFETLLVLPHSPFACEGGTSVARTVTATVVLTFGIVNCNAWALGSVQGLVFEGQLKTASCGGGFVPTGNVRATGVGGGIKLAVTFSDELIVKLHVGFVPRLAQAPPQLAKVEGAVGVAVSVTGVPLA